MFGDVSNFEVAHLVQPTFQHLLHPVEQFGRLRTSSFRFSLLAFMQLQVLLTVLLLFKVVFDAMHSSH